MARFEIVSKYIREGKDIVLPERKTACSAGYDFQVAEDILIQPYSYLMDRIRDVCPAYVPYTLADMADATKDSNARPTLVPTGIKCKLEKDKYLELSVRSSSPLKYWLLLANSEGIIDADYYNNPSNEGEIFFQIINFSPYPIMLHKGDIIGQGIIKQYCVTEDDTASGARLGGFGSTS